MKSTPTQSDLVGLGISQTYASLILRGLRSPSKSLAVHIYQELGWMHPVLEGLSKADIEAFARVQPWERAA